MSLHRRFWPGTLSLSVWMLLCTIRWPNHTNTNPIYPCAKVSNPLSAICNNDDYNRSTRLLAQTTLRFVPYISSLACVPVTSWVQECARHKEPVRDLIRQGEHCRCHAPQPGEIVTESRLRNNYHILGGGHWPMGCPCGQGWDKGCSPPTTDAESNGCWGRGHKGCSC